MSSGSQKIVLYQPRYTPITHKRRTLRAPLALIAVSSLLPQEQFDVAIISDNLYPQPAKSALEHAQDALCVGISAMTSYQIIDGLRTAQLVRERYPHLPIVWGGWHPTMEPEQTLESPYVDIIVRGQGPRTIIST